MDRRTGKIKPYEEIPQDQKFNFSEPFKVGDEVEFKGVVCEIIRIKMLRGEVHLKFKKTGALVKSSGDKRKKVVSPPEPDP